MEDSVKKMSFCIYQNTVRITCKLSVFLGLLLLLGCSSYHNERREIRDYMEKVLTNNGITGQHIDKAYYTNDKRIVIYYKKSLYYPFWGDYYYVVIRNDSESNTDKLIVFDKQKDFEQFCKQNMFSYYSLLCEYAK